MERLEQGHTVADNIQSIKEFKSYLKTIDELYADIKNNGYDPNSVIVVSIGREGEWMVHQGNHRRTISRIVGIDSVPVRIKYRHKQWQELRDQIYHNGLSEEHIQLRNHPDLQNILD